MDIQKAIETLKLKKWDIEMCIGLTKQGNEFIPRQSSPLLEAISVAIEILEAKAEGRLIELPCKVGSKVYEPETDESARVDSVEIYFHTHMGAYTLDDFGETVFVFLTREEAEQALREQAID